MRRRTPDHRVVRQVASWCLDYPDQELVARLPQLHAALDEAPASPEVEALLRLVRDVNLLGRLVAATLAGAATVIAAGPGIPGENEEEQKQSNEDGEDNDRHRREAAARVSVVAMAVRGHEDCLLSTTRD